MNDARPPPEICNEKTQRKKVKDVIKTETLPSSIIQSKTDAPYKLNNKMNCQEGAITMTNTAAAATNTFNSFSDLPLVLNANQLAGVLNISRANAYRLMRSESFPTLRVGNRMLVVRDNLLHWMDEQILAS